MRISDRGIAFLVAHEGIVPAPYLDSVGVWTYGVGHTAAAGPPVPASMPRGMPVDLDAGLRDVFALFRRDLEAYEAAVTRALAGLDVAQHQFDAAVSFHFNTGAIASASWVKTWRGGDKARAAIEIMNWSKPKEIIPRRQAEQALFSEGSYGAMRASVWPVDAAGRITWKPVRTLTQSAIIELLRPPARPAPIPVLPEPVPVAAPSHIPQSQSSLLAPCWQRHSSSEADMTRPDPTDHRDQIQHFATALRNIIDLIPGGGDTAHMRADAQASVAVAKEQALAALEESVK